MRAYRADAAFDGERVLPGGALVFVDGGSIVGVEPAPAPVPDGCPVTHLPGTTLLPGLIDAHVHLCGNGGPDALDRIPSLSTTELDAVIDASVRTQLAAGVTSVRDLGDHQFAVVSRPTRTRCRRSDSASRPAWTTSNTAPAWCPAGLSRPPT